MLPNRKAVCVPRPCTELVVERLAQYTQRLPRLPRLLRQQQTKQLQRQHTHDRLRAQIWQAGQTEKTPISASESLRVARRRQAWQARLPRLEKQLATGVRVNAQHQAALDALTQEQRQLQNWLNVLEQTTVRIPSRRSVKRGWTAASAVARISAG